MFSQTAKVKQRKHAALIFAVLLIPSLSITGLDGQAKNTLEQGAGLGSSLVPPTDMDAASNLAIDAVSRELKSACKTHRYEKVYSLLNTMPKSAVFRKDDSLQTLLAAIADRTGHHSQCDSILKELESVPGNTRNSETGEVYKERWKIYRWWSSGYIMNSSAERGLAVISVVLLTRALQSFEQLNGSKPSIEHVELLASLAAACSQNQEWQKSISLYQRAEGELEELQLLKDSRLIKPSKIDDLRISNWRQIATVYEENGDTRNSANNYLRVLDECLSKNSSVILDVLQDYVRMLVKSRAPQKRYDTVTTHLTNHALKNRIWSGKFFANRNYLYVGSGDDPAEDRKINEHLAQMRQAIIRELDTARSI